MKTRIALLALPLILVLALGGCTDGNTASRPERISRSIKPLSVDVRIVPVDVASLPDDYRAAGAVGDDLAILLIAGDLSYRDAVLLPLRIDGNGCQQ